jgi:hypothetical protein
VKSTLSRVSTTKQPTRCRFSGNEYPGFVLNTSAANHQHSNPTCTVAGSGQTGTLASTDCGSATGCTTLSTDITSYGVDFNDNAGGVFATQWNSDFIRMWFFPPGSVPADIINGTPDPTLPAWGLPVANFQGTCNIDGLFMDNKIVFDTNFCTAAVEAKWSGTTCPATTGFATCRDYISSFPAASADDFQNL